MGFKVNTKQTRILCMNKVDLVEKKKDLLIVVDQFKDLPDYEGTLFLLSNDLFSPFPLLKKVKICSSLFPLGTHDLWKRFWSQRSYTIFDGTGMFLFLINLLNTQQ